MKRFTKLMITAALAAVVVAAAACSGARSTGASRSGTHTPHPETNSAAPLYDTRGFRVYNYTGEDVKLTKKWHGAGENCGDDTLEGGGPPIGEVIHPGTSYMDFELANLAYTYTWCNLYFDALNGSGTKVAEFSVIIGNQGFTGSGTAPGGPSVQPATPNPPEYQLKSSPPNVEAGVRYSTIKLLDPPLTIHPVSPDPPTHNQAQAVTINQLCKNNTEATCWFTPTKEETGIAGPEVVMGTRANPNTNLTTFPLNVTKPYRQTNSMSVDMTAGTDLSALAGGAAAEVKAAYNHEWQTSIDYTLAGTLEVPGRCTASVTLTATVIRDDGNFTIVLGNTVWILTGVYFDSPDPSAHPVFTPHASLPANGDPCPENAILH